jgi:hypothetical protein
VQCLAHTLGNNDSSQMIDPTDDAACFHEISPFYIRRLGTVRFLPEYLYRYYILFPNVCQ